MKQRIFSGIDLVEIQRFRDLNPLILNRFFERVFTPAEITYINGSFSRAAGIFAAKEAAVKALGSGIGPIRWHDVEIDRTVEKQPLLKLHGPAQERARKMCISEWSISITHTKSTAAAVAIAAVISSTK